jgi:hypothetical protein
MPQHINALVREPRSFGRPPHVIRDHLSPDERDVTYRMHVFGSPRTMPSALAARSCVEFIGQRLECQRDLRLNIWTCYLLPFWPGMGLILVGDDGTPDRRPFALGTAVLAVMMASQIAWINKRSARTFRDDR